MKKFGILVAAIALASASFTATAADGTGAYIRAEVGNSTLHYDGDSAVDTAMSGWVGYNFNRTFAIEAHAGSLGEDSGDGASVKMSAVGLGARVKHDFESGLYIAGRVGVERINTDIAVGSFRSEEKANQAYVGLGVGYQLNPSFALTGYFDTRQAPFVGDKQRVDTLTIGAEFSF